MTRKQLQVCRKVIYCSGCDLEHCDCSSCISCSVRIEKCPCQKRCFCNTIDQFELHGCDNCEEYLHLKNNRTAVYDCTSSNFDGFVALMDPKDSWVAKWQRAGGFVKGCYAISVTGRLPPGVVRSIKQKGVIYRSRDTSQKS